MKIRIKGASVRFRLTKTEVSRLVSGEKVADFTPFPVGAFRYAVVGAADVRGLEATFEGGEILLRVPLSLLAGWDRDDRVSLQATMPLNETEGLHLLLEKDFKCLDGREEEQTDHYDNPAQSC